MKRRYIFVIIIIVIIAGVLGYFFATNRNQNQQVQKQQQNQSNGQASNSTQSIHLYERSVEPKAYFETNNWKFYSDKYISFKYPKNYKLATSTALSFDGSLGLHVSIYDPRPEPNQIMEGDIIENGFIDIAHIKDTYNHSLDNYLPQSDKGLINKDRIKVDSQDTYVVKGWRDTSSKNLRLTFFKGNLYLFSSDVINMDSQGNYLPESDYEKIFDTVLTTIKFLE